MAHHRSSVVLGWIRATVAVVAVASLVFACSNPTSSDDNAGGNGNGGNGGGNGGVLFSEGAGLTYNGVTYTTIIVGTQEWMAENLRTATLNNGTTTIENRPDPNGWGEVTYPAWSYYDNLSANDAIYGKLYSGYTATNPNLSPVGWRVPTITDWNNLISALGGASLAGGRMKETGTERWQTPNTGANNNGGFSARPAGYLAGAGSGSTGLAFRDLGAATVWWSSTVGTTGAEYLQGVSVNYQSGAATVSVDGYFMRNGYSIRLVRDVE